MWCLDCLSRRYQEYQDSKCKEEKSEKIEQKIELHNSKRISKEGTARKNESKETVSIVKIESPKEPQEKSQVSVSQKDLNRSSDTENGENEKSAFMVSGN